jgi:hypothetical protein
MPAQSPPPRAAAAITFDSRRRLVVLYGGVAVNALADVWTYDGTTWAPDVAPTSPPLLEPALADDRARSRLVLTGRAGSGSLDRETWEFDGLGWARVAVGEPRARSVAPQPVRVVYDEVDDSVLAYFERALWRWQTPHPAVILTYGASCATTLGPLTLTATDRPWLGDTLHGSLTPVPATSAAGIFVGASNRQWGGTPLPFALTALGAPGCTVLAEPILLLLPPLGSTTRPWSLTLPSTPALAGAQLYAQAVALDPLANAFGLATSGALELRLGLR